MGQGFAGSGHGLHPTAAAAAYGDCVERSPFVLAALASVAVPGLDPTGVELVPSAPEHLFDVAFVTDSQDRRWVVRAPRTEAAAAQMEMSSGLLALLARRVPFSVPSPKGFVPLKEGGRACVYPYLPGRTVDFGKLPAGQGLAIELGRTIAALHNIDARLFDEAGLPAYEADTYRTRRLADLDRAASSGRVPTSLLNRWEAALEDVNLWRFAPTPVHGDLTGDQVLAVFEDPQDAATGKVKALTGWEDAKVADPADDFASLVAEAEPEALETVMEAYAHTRVERPDANLLVRARLASELALLGELMRALTAGYDEAADAHTAALRRLDEEVHAHEEADNDYKRTSLEPVNPIRRSVPPPLTVDDDEETWGGGDDLPPAVDARSDAADESSAPAPVADEADGPAAVGTRPHSTDEDHEASGADRSTEEVPEEVPEWLADPGEVDSASAPDEDSERDNEGTEGEQQTPRQA